MTLQIINGNIKTIYWALILKIQGLIYYWKLSGFCLGSYYQKRSLSFQVKILWINWSENQNDFYPLKETFATLFVCIFVSTQTFSCLCNLFFKSWLFHINIPKFTQGDSLSVGTGIIMSKHAFMCCLIGCGMVVGTVIGKFHSFWPLDA